MEASIPYSQTCKSFYNTHRLQLLPSVQLETDPEVSFDQLSLKQKMVYSLVKKQLEQPLEVRQVNGFKLLWLGCAGSGKSATLLWVKKLLEWKKEQEHGFEFKVCSYTGMSAYQIGGETIHSAFRLNPFNHNYDEQVKNFERRVSQDPVAFQFYGKIQFLVLDEISTVGLGLLTCIHKMLQITHPKQGDLPFGGVNILMFGDPFQCPSIGDYSAWAPIPIQKKDLGVVRREYYKISNCFFMDTSFRQRDMEYFSFLTRLRNHVLTNEDVKMINARKRPNLMESEQKAFEDALHLFPRNVLVHMENRSAIQKRFPSDKIYKIRNGLHCLYLAIGADVHLRSNFCQKAGLCNGSKAVVKKVIFTPQFIKACGPVEIGIDVEFTAEDVECIIVHVPDYKGNLIVTTEDGTVGLPIFKTKDAIEMPNGRVEMMNVFKISLAYAVTIDRSQGLTLDKAAVYLSGTEEEAGLDYVAFSRVRGWEQIMILDAAIHPNRFNAFKTLTMNKFKASVVEEKRVRRLEENMMVTYDGAI